MTDGTSERARRILILEDDESIARMLAMLLNDAGYASDVAITPDAARGTYDLIISDYLAPSFLPGQPWPHLDSLRRLSGGAPILGCTAHRDAAFGELANLGVSAVVIKPFDLDHVLATVDNLLGAKGTGAAPSGCVC